MKILLVAIFVVAIAIPIAARAYTSAEREFCKPDAMRLCTGGQLFEAFAGNYGGIEACFRQHRRELSRACVDSIRRARGK